MKYLTFLILVFISNISLAHSSATFHFQEVSAVPINIAIAIVFLSLLLIFLREKKKP
tara:strand:- start:1028 stop:1198 length:171 start_codon:yes stop_codon:yes gene_type:complete